MPVTMGAQFWQQRADETRALAYDMKHQEARTIMLRIAADYEKLAGLAAARAAKGKEDKGAVS